jgi:hypothetical protein
MWHSCGRQRRFEILELGDSTWIPVAFSIQNLRKKNSTAYLPNTRLQHSTHPTVQHETPESP